MQSDLRSQRGALWPFFTSPTLSRFLSQPVHNATQYLGMLDEVDRAADQWLSLTAGISLNVFQGFGSETDMVDFFLSQSYSQNLSVIAGV